MNSNNDNKEKDCKHLTIEWDVDLASVVCPSTFYGKCIDCGAPQVLNVTKDKDE